MKLGAPNRKKARPAFRMPLPEERRQREQRSVSGYIVFLSVLFLITAFAPNQNFNTFLFLLANLGGLLAQIWLSAFSRSIRVAGSVALAQGAYIAVSFLPGQQLSAASITGAIATAIVFGTMFFIAGLVAATLMRLADMQRWEVSRKRMGRHQRIGILLDLRERIRFAQLRGEPEVKDSWTDKISRNLFGLSFAFGFGLDLFFVVGTWIAERSGRPVLTDSGLSIAVIFIYSLSLLGVLGANLLIGYCSGRFPRMLLAAAILTLAGSSYLIWPGHPTHMILYKANGSNIFWQGIGVSILVCAVGWLTAFVQQRTEKIWKLQRGDASALSEEIQRLENSLLSDQSRKCVVAVDVVGSTRMKSNADQLVSEWCFREYQQIVTQCVEDEGGQVVNTAGDGVVASFEDPASALEASAAIHDRLLAFNARGNRLSEPFQVRIGIDSAEVQGNLAEVQFSQLIDTAAHIEALTPPGAIGVSQAFMTLMPNERATQHGYTGEGVPIFLMRESGPARWAEPLPSSS